MSSPEETEEDGPPIQDPHVPAEEKPEPESDDDEAPTRPSNEKVEDEVAATSEARSEPPIPDPLAQDVVRTEAERSAAIVLAARASWLSTASFLAGGLALVMTVVSLAGKIDYSVIVSVLPLGVANIVVGVQARRASHSIQDLSKSYRDRDAILSSVQEISRVFVVQLLATIFFVLLMVLALSFAFLMRGADAR
jgi:hypothetical protein